MATKTGKAREQVQRRRDELLGRERALTVSMLENTTVELERARRVVATYESRRDELEAALSAWDEVVS